MKSKIEALDPNLRKHFLVGAGLGVYLGIAYRHPSEPNASLVTIIGLSIFTTIVIGLFRLFQEYRKEGGSFLEVSKELPLTFAKIFVIMLLLAARFYIWEFGGRVLTVVYTTALGAGAGALIYWKGSGKSSLI
ncbi:MAG: hypothetical protein AB8G95_00620 [Anaerolineae bacterium]